MYKKITKLLGISYPGFVLNFNIFFKTTEKSGHSKNIGSLLQYWKRDSSLPVAQKQGIAKPKFFVIVFVSYKEYIKKQVHKQVNIQVLRVAFAYLPRQNRLDRRTIKNFILVKLTINLLKKYVTVKYVELWNCCVCLLEKGFRFF